MRQQDDMTTMNVSLPGSLRDFITARAKGRFGSVSEYVRELIRADQSREAEERLEALLLDGLESGDPVEVTPEFWERKRQELRRRMSSRPNA